MTADRSKKGYNFEPLSWEVLGACIQVQRQLGRHCMEVDYQRALAMELRKRGIQFKREFEISIVYDGVIVTRRRVDFLIWDDTDELLLETKARKTILDEDVEQCLLYLQNGEIIEFACWSILGRNHSAGNDWSTPQRKIRCDPKPVCS